MRQYFQFFALFVLATLTIHSQELPNIVPPSPEASEMAKYTNVPVSYYTGLPNISVPFYTISTKGVQIPINLSYHAKGVQVAQVASRTGLGWSLSYGGSISRQVRGKGDESPNYGYLQMANYFKTYASDFNTRVAVDGIETFNQFDFYPDQFNFSAGGMNGKFILDYNDEQPVIQSFGDVTISCKRENITTGKIESFLIIDAQGNKYYYGISKDGLRTGQDYQDASGMSIYNNGNVQTDPATSGSERVYSSWKLMDIETHYGELISYYYDFGNTASYYSKSLDKHTSTEPERPNSIDGMNDLNGMYTRISLVWNYEKHLSKIEFNKGRDSIVFHQQSTMREDFNNQALEEIEIYSQGNKLKSFKFNYSYTTSTDQTNLLPHFIGNPNFAKTFKRLFLDSIEEEGGNGQILPPYSFTYDSTVLPSRLSTRQDYWGYYNGATDNGPFLRMFEYGNYIPDRRVHTQNSEAGILKEITYPTGGTTKFTYEDNVGMAPPYFDDVRTPDINPGSVTQVEIILTKSDFYNNSTGNYDPVSLTFPGAIVTYKVDCFHFRDVNDPPGIPDCIFDFTLEGHAISVGVSEDFTTCSDNTKVFGVSPNAPGFPNLHLDPDYDFEIRITYHNPTTSNELYAGGKRIKRIDYAAENLTTFKEFEYVNPNGLGLSGAVIGLPSFLSVLSPFGPDPCQRIISYYYDSSSAYGLFQPNTIGYSYVTEYFGTNNNNHGKNEYTFTNLADSGGDYYIFPYHPPTDNEWLRGKNVRTKTYKSTSGNNYELVKEVYNKYRYHDQVFTNDFELPGFVNLNLEFNDEGILHGWETNGWHTNDYTVTTTDTRTLFRLPFFMREGVPWWNPAFDPAGNPPDNTGYRIYYLTGGTVNLESTTKTNYYNGNPLVTTNTYTYNYDKHYQTQSSTVTSSDSESIITKSYYPEDVTSIAALGADNLTTGEKEAIDKLKTDQQHRLSEVIQTETYKDNNLNGISESSELVSRQRTNYKDWDATLGLPSSTDLVLPEYILASKGANGALEDRIVFESYYDNGNLKEVSKKDGSTIVYIWGYNELSPIAKIENATYSQISSQVSSLKNLSNADDDRTIGAVGNEGSLRTALTNLRNSLPNAMVTTYTYDPLIGVTSITDPKGYTSYYEYDEFNRLIRVKDADGNILSENEYYYKNQNQQP